VNKLLVVTMLCALAGCAVEPRQASYPQPRDPSQWRVVSVTPVPAGTAARVAAAAPDGKAVEYSSTPMAAAPAYRPAPAYSGAPVYAPAPVYQPEPYYYWPPVSLSLGFVFGRHWSSGRHWHGRHR
jgi:hypothetical protein